jgi:(5-formylfuran-3-yl)methyl phosphate synthase
MRARAEPELRHGRDSALSIAAMTLMLASVVDAAEAELALKGGADVIDFGDSGGGALGAVPVEAIGKGIEAIGKRRPVSAALGAPPYEAEALTARGRALKKAGVDWVRFAADAGALDRLHPAVRALTHEIGLFGVLLADEAADFGLLARMAALGFKGAFLDVDKTSGRRLLDCLAPHQIAAFSGLCRRHGLLSCLAGSLQPPDVPRLMLVEPDVLGFRSALTARGRRGGPLDAGRIALIRDLIPRENADAASAPQLGAPPANALDIIFLRDFLATAEIGAYAHERGAKQRVLFNVEASIRRVAAHADDMRAIFSYDVILDAIRLVVGRGHIDFIETIAEDVAAIVLKHPRVDSVRVRVEKLDLVPGSVGVEITRGR